MHRTRDIRVGLTNAQETVQTVLLIVVSFVGTWLALYRVPWRVSLDPCLIAATAMAVIVICLWLTRWRGVRGVTFERYLLAGFLVYMALVYVMRYLFASTGGAANHWLWVEILKRAHFCSSRRAQCEELRPGSLPSESLCTD